MTTDPRPGETSSYLDYLPAVFEEDALDGQPTFLGRFLLAFEHVLTGLGVSSDPGIEEVLEGTSDPLRPLRGIERYFDPTAPPSVADPAARPLQQAPAEFLEWLSGWVAIALRADHSEGRRRELIANAVQLYRLRGTRAGVERFIQAYTGLAATVEEETARFQIEDHSQIGVDTLLGGGAPYFFRVAVHLLEVGDIPKYRDLLLAAVDQAKPAHTYYALEFVTPVFQLEVSSRIGVDTVLSPEPL